MAVVLVCVTGAGGFIGSWIVKLLLARGYAVRGTSRAAADDPRNAHLWALDGAAERLAMARVDLLDRAALRAAFDGCDGVIHTAAPLVGDPAEILDGVIAGTRNVVEAAADAGVRRLVLSSTISAMYMDPRRDPDAPLDESSWSDLDYCIKTKNWYSYAKTVAEKSAWEAARARGLDMAVVVPVIALGEMLQPGLNVSTTHITKYLNGEVATYANAAHAYVHVGDAAEAHVRVLEVPAAGGRRYVCAESSLHRGELCRALAELFQEYPIPTRCKDEVNPPNKGYKFTNQPLKDLGMKFTPLREYLYEAVRSLQEKGFIQKTTHTKVANKRIRPTPTENLPTPKSTAKL
ncbi:unnamed protein product [Urochloa humidicola]